MIRLQFTRGSGVSSAAIAWFSSGIYSHVDCVLPDGTLLGARSDVVGGHPPGVWIRPPDYEKFAHRLVMEIPAGAFQEARYHQFLKQQLGRPYDKWAIWGFALGRNWREDDSWICSELQAAALEHAQVTPPLFLAAHKITPVALALVASAVKGRIVTQV